MEPAKITPTDLRQFKRWLVERRRLKLNTVNRKLATLNFFSRWLVPPCRRGSCGRVLVALSPSCGLLSLVGLAP
jgi:hypothetical protein